jgi:ketosteroid isomerase-like protein
MTTSSSLSTEEIGEQIRAAFNDGDLSTVKGLLDPQVQWGPPGDEGWGCHNRREVLAWLGRALSSGVRAEVRDVVAHGGKLLVGLRVHGRETADRGGGAEERWQVMTVRDGRIVDVRGFEGRAAAAAFAGVQR